MAGKDFGGPDVSAVLGIIPARAGSKGIPDKNLKPLAGLTLIGYAARAARDSRVIDRLVLSTDSDAIAALGRSEGVEVPFLRPASLAADDTPMLPVLQHVVAHLEGEGWRPDLVVLLQPTSPLRRGEHVARAVEVLRDTGCDAVASVVEVPRHLSPDYVMRLDEGRLVPFLPEGARVTRRQDARAAYVRDGTVYAFRRDVLMERNSIYGDDCRPLVVPARESVTLDSPEDWEEAERLLQAACPGA